MTIDLTRLCENHPAVPTEVLAPYVHKAAIALQRRHCPGVALDLHINDDEAIVEQLTWPLKDGSDAEFLDTVRITEEGAEAIALAVIEKQYGWTAIRRIQRNAFADWLLARGDSEERIALEIGGTDKEDDGRMLREKVAQVMKCPLTAQRAACVVRFLEPRCKLQVIPEAPR